MQNFFNRLFTDPPLSSLAVARCCSFSSLHGFLRGSPYFKIRRRIECHALLQQTNKFVCVFVSTHSVLCVSSSIATLIGSSFCQTQTQYWLGWLEKANICEMHACNTSLTHSHTHPASATIAGDSYARCLLI